MSDENRRLAIALIAGLILVAAMYAFGQWTAIKARDWIEQGRDLSLAERLFLNLGIFVASFWWLMAPVVVVACIAFAALWSHLRSHRTSRR